ncbi:hypothetical protein HHI36_020252 [Cryptolaemus montrouzieri]|uniref:Amino acid transporter transmembrane domain-containing protein n=1 Tax=Cryptolaemus montrouzieri TaxID=559131 RepID=A0ABD2NA25_9CUCU
MPEVESQGIVFIDKVTEEEYNPYAHRAPKRPLNNTQAFVLLTKGALGIGLLPSALTFKEGWVTGVIYTCVMGVIVTHCLHILFRAQRHLCKHLKIPYLTYSESVRRALEYGPLRSRKFSKYVPFFVDTSMLMGQFALCTTYALFVLQTFGFFEQYTGGLYIGLKRYVYCFLLMIPCIFIVFLGNWKIVAGFAAFANIILIFPIFIFLSYVNGAQSPSNDLVAVGDLYQFPKVFGPILFALEAVAVVSTFEGDLKHPKKFIGSCGVLNIGMFLVTSVYILVGCLGYWRFGEASVGSFLNDMPLNDTASKWCRALYTLSIYLSYGVQGFVMVHILWKKKHRGHDQTFKHIFRIAIVGISTIIITFVPFIVRTAILDAMFAVSLPVLGVILPAFMEFCVVWPTHGNNRNKILWKDVFLIVLGLANCIAELYFCAEQLIEFFSVRRKPIFW